MEKDYLLACADAVARQLSESPGLSLSVDPQVADYMGAFEETAISKDDLADDSSLTATDQGVVYAGE